MKAIYRSSLLIFLFLLCGAPSIYFDILVPATIDVPSNLNSIALIDRSLSESEMVNVLEKGLLSAISGKSDRLSVNCIEGLFDQLNAQNRVKPLKTGMVEKRKGTAIDFPEPMQWFEVEKICNENKADGLLALEIFSRQYVEGVAEVKVGFRLYDPSGKMIIDEFQYYHGIGKAAPAPGADPGSLIMNSINNDDAMKKAAYIAGTIYGKRISPFWIRVKRDYFKKSKRDPKMAEGARMMEVNDWDAAIDAFLLAIEHGHPKTKGRAANNLAIVYEINGNLDLAYKTAQDAWGKYGNKAAREYSGILQQRIYELNVLKNQEEN